MLIRRNWLHLIFACLALAMAALAAACGGGGDDDDGGGVATSAPARTGDATPTGAGSGDGDDPLDGSTFEVNETFWHSGFEVELGQGTVAATTDVFGEIKGYVLSVDGTFTNLGESSSFFNPEMSIVQGTKNYRKSAQGDVPQAGSGLTGEGTLVFIIDDAFDYLQSKLVVGSGDETRAEIPFAPGAGELVSLEPSEVTTVTGTAALDQIDLDFTGAELRYDLPFSFEEVDDGHIALTLNFNATSRKSGNWTINSQDFSLTKPNGNSVSIDGSHLASLPGSAEGLTTEDLYVRFIVDADSAGDYSLRFKPGSYWIETGPEEATFDFTLP